MQTAGDEMVRQLRAWQDARWVVKARVSCTLLILGLACVAGSQFALLVGAGLDCGSDTHCPAYPVTWLMLCMGLCICCYAPLSDDTWLARMVLMLTAVIMGSEVNWEFCWNRAEDPCPVLGGLPLQGNAAASIAGLLGGCDARQAFAEAAARFRCIDLSMITEEEMAIRDPDPVLFKRSVQVPLGECDAFISHSWSDGAAGKWALLQRWREAFIAKHGREPKVWIDKCCADQADIAAYLRCLPIFLSSCREMVVLCGPTYFQRLWCVMELFTHYRTGLFHNRLTLLPVMRAGQHDDVWAAIHAAVSSFDARRCECGSTSHGDRDRLMDIIQADGIQEFNAAVRAVLVRAFSSTLGSGATSSAEPRACARARTPPTPATSMSADCERGEATI